MIAITGIAFEVDADTPEEAEDIVRDFLTVQFEGVTPSDPVKPLKFWTAAEYDTETRDAGFKYKDLRCRLDPEYGLTPIGKIMLERRLQEHAEAQAKEIAESQVSDN